MVIQAELTCEQPHKRKAHYERKGLGWGSSGWAGGYGGLRIGVRIIVGLCENGLAKAETEIQDIIKIRFI